jgi:serine/threonine-protein kinase
MATVFLARDVRHDRPVALKVLHPDLAHALGPERFQREVRMAARLQHPHILTVFDSGDAGGHLWFTMPYIEGESLRERLDRERQLPVDDALRIAREAAQALEYAHRHGVVHRDIKPENLLLTQDGNTLVADFGIARALGGTEQRLTETGLAVGTPAYMSPEQASGENDLTARSDIYSLGAVLYEMLAGEPPFTGPTAQAVIAKRFSGTVPSVRQTRPSVPEAVEQAVTRALAVVPADRYASAAELARALETSTQLATAQATVASPRTSAGPLSRPWKSPAFLMLVLGFLLGTGVFVAWRKHAAADDRARVPTVAVLPFENLGAQGDEYFADGITDEVRGKLSTLAGLRVIATASSRQYKQSSKPLATIASELGVDYLLVGKVRWARGADSGSQVRVSPELVQVNGGTATVRWTQPFQASLTDVFKVQSDIAGQVAGALDVALGADQRQQLAERPTKSLAAYDAYLRARSIGGFDVPSTRQRLTLYEEAVSLDSSFAAAWSELSASNSLIYSNSTPSPAIAARAKAAADRANALDPNGALPHWALHRYQYLVRRDPEAAEREAALGLAVEPNRVELLTAASDADRLAGRFEAALARLRRAEQLDPRSPAVLGRLQNTLLGLHRFGEAIVVSDELIAISPNDPTNVLDKALAYLAQGNLGGAKALVRQFSTAMKREELLAYFANIWDLYWVLDDAQQKIVLGLGPEYFYSDSTAWAFVRMEVHELRGDRAASRAWAESAYVASMRVLRDVPDDPQRPMYAALQLAYMGRKAEAIDAGEKARGRLPVSRDAVNGPYMQHILARVYLMAGEPEKALDILESLVKLPYFVTPAWLRIDPTWAPLKGNPRFERLIAAS